MRPGTDLENFYSRIKIAAITDPTQRATSLVAPVIDPPMSAQELALVDAIQVLHPFPAGAEVQADAYLRSAANRDAIAPAFFEYSRAAAAKAVADAAAAATAAAAVEAAAAAAATAAAAREATTAENAAAAITEEARTTPLLAAQIKRLEASAADLAAARKPEHTELEKAAILAFAAKGLSGNFYKVELGKVAKDLMVKANMTNLLKADRDNQYELNRQAIAAKAFDTKYDAASKVSLKLPQVSQRSWMQFRKDLFILGIIPLPLPLLWKALVNANKREGYKGVLKLIVFKILPIVLVIGGAIALAVVFPPILAPFAAGLAWSVGLFSAVTLPPLAITVISTAILMLSGLIVVKLPAIISGFRSLVSYFTGKKAEALPANVAAIAGTAGFSVDRLANALNQANLALENSKQFLDGGVETAKLKVIIHDLKESGDDVELQKAVENYVAWHNEASGVKAGGTKEPMEARHFMTGGKALPNPPADTPPLPAHPGIAGASVTPRPAAAGGAAPGFKFGSASEPEDPSALARITID